MKQYKLRSTELAKVCINVVFYITAVFFPVYKRKVTFASYRTDELTGNLYWVYQELQNRTLGYSCTFLLKTYHTSIFGKISYLLHMMKAGYHLATSRYFFIDDYYFPIYVIKPRRKTEIIQLWHAAGAFKKFGYSTSNKTFGPSEDYLRHVKVHSNYSKVIVSSSEVVPYYAEAFNMPAEDILPLGIPRTDYFFWYDEHKNLKERFYSQFPGLKGKQLILYAPTFRGRSHNQGILQLPLDLSLFAQSLGSEYAMLIHLHPYMHGQLKVDQQIKDLVYHIEAEFKIQELMILSDMLVTDYSSVVFDFSLLDRPVAFFADDLEEYSNERGFYYDYRSFIPGPLFTRVDQLVSWIKEGQFDHKALKKFRNRYFDDIDGNASWRIVDYFFGQTPVTGSHAVSSKAQGKTVGYWDGGTNHDVSR